MDNRLNKIRALLAQAESTNFPEEAKAFTAKAQELMTLWAIDEAMLAHSRPADDFKVVFVEFPMAYSPYQGPREQLLAVVGKAQNVRVILRSGKVYYDENGDRILNKKGQPSHRNTSTATLCGVESAVEMTQVLYTSLLLQAEREFLTEPVQTLMVQQAPKPGNRIRWRNSWMIGYIAEIRTRLAASKKTVETAAGPSTALVLVDQSKLVDRAVSERYNRLSTKHTNNRIHAGAVGSGRISGQRADIGSPRIGSNAAIGSGR